MGEWWGIPIKTDEALLTCLLLSSCWAAQFLTGNGLVPICGLIVGDPFVDYSQWGWYSVCSLLLLLLSNSFLRWGSVQFSSVTQKCPTLCNPMNCSMPGLLVHHHLPEFTQTHVYGVSDAIQPSHPLSSPSPPAPNPSQRQSLFQWVNSSHEVAKVLELQL